MNFFYELFIPAKKQEEEVKGDAEERQALLNKEINVEAKNR